MFSASFLEFSSFFRVFLLPAYHPARPLMPRRPVFVRPPWIVRHAFVPLLKYLSRRLPTVRIDRFSKKREKRVLVFLTVPTQVSVRGGFAGQSYAKAICEDRNGRNITGAKIMLTPGNASARGLRGACGLKNLSGEQCCDTRKREVNNQKQWRTQRRKTISIYHEIRKSGYIQII
jgi:hypothetical protein